MSERQPTASRRALIFAAGDLNDGPAVRAALEYAPQAAIIAADGGARLAERCGLRPDLIVGDLDSLSGEEADRFAAQGATIERVTPHKDETDLELALLAAARRGATWIRAIGATGDRLDQTLAAVHMLVMPQLDGRDARLVAGRQTLWVVGPGEHALDGAPGDTISLIPLAGDARGVRTEALEYPLRGETLVMGAARGVSNVMAASRAGVALESGLLVVVHTVGRA